MSSLTNSPDADPPPTPDEATSPPQPPGATTGSEGPPARRLIVTSFDDDVPDLPEASAAGFTLPMKPSSDLPPEARDWVSRFLPDQAPGAERAAESSPPPVLADDSSDSSDLGPSHAFTPDEHVPGAAPAAHGPRGRPRPRRARRRHDSRSVGVLAAILVLSAVGLLARQRLSIEPSPGADLSRTSALAIGPPPPAAAVGRSVVGTQVKPTDARSRSATATRDGKPAAARSRPAPAPAPYAPASGVAAESTPASALPPPADSQSAGSPEAATANGDAAEPGPHHRGFGLEVGSYLDQERAEAERGRLVAEGHPALLLTRSDGGTTVYRVVLGPFRSRAKAERAADPLLSAGTIQQARVIRLSARE